MQARRSDNIQFKQLKLGFQPGFSLISPLHLITMELIHSTKIYTAMVIKHNFKKSLVRKHNILYRTNRDYMSNYKHK